MAQTRLCSTLAVANRKSVAKRRMPTADRRLPTGPSLAGIGRGLLFVHLLLSPLVFWRGTLEAFEYNKVALLTGTAILLCGLGAMAVAGRALAIDRIRCLVRIPAVWGVGLFLLSACLSTVFSISPRTSFWGAHESYAGLLTCLAYVVLFFATVFLLRDAEDCRRLTFAAVIAAGVASAYALLQVMHHDPLAWDRVSGFEAYVRPFGTMGHPNLLAAYLAMALPLIVHSVIQALKRERRLAALLFGVIAVASVVSVVLTLSRGGWLALGAGALVMGLGRGWLAGKGSVRRFMLAGCGVATAALVLLFALAWFGELGTVADRGSQFTEAGGRPYIWKAACEVFRERPVLGSGVDTFQLAFGAHRDLGFWRWEWNLTPTKVHNEIFQIFATQGAVGGIAVVVLLYAVGASIIRLWRRGDPAHRSLLVALTAGLVAFGIQALFSFTVAGCGTLVVTIAVIIVRMQLPADEQKRISWRMPGWIRGVKALLIVATLAALWVVVLRPWQANEACSRAEASAQDDLRGAIIGAEKAVKLDGEKDYYWMRLGSLCEASAWQTMEKAEREACLRRARQAYEQAVRLAPASAYHHVNLGRVRGELALTEDVAREEVFDEFDAALRLDPNNVYFHAEAGTAAIRLGDRERARQYIERGQTCDPTFGPLVAERGYLAYAEERWGDALHFLEQSLQADWHGDSEGRRRAEWVLGIARSQFAARTKPLPEDAGR
jgi:O-antigen ligase